MQQNMKKTAPIIALMALILLAGCNSNKKINTYENIYSEKPVTIYIAPIQDHSTRKPEKYPKDIDYNNELNTEGYPPDWDDEVFRRVLEQMENYKKSHVSRQRRRNKEGSPKMDEYCIISSSDEERRTKGD